MRVTMLIMIVRARFVMIARIGLGAGALTRPTTRPHPSDDINVV